MTIHQLPDRCWATVPASLDGDDERQPHYDGEADALQAIKEAREDNPDLTATARQLDAPCWVAQCDGECETVIDEEDECYAFHHASRADAEQTAAAHDFRHVSGGLMFCEDDVPEGTDSEPFLTAAELEAAGQMRLPGVA